VVGSLTSIQNFFGNVGGLLAPIVTGYIVQSTGSFVGSLVVAGGMALLGAISYVFIMGNLETHRIEPRISAAAVPLSPSRAL
jgi:dipeptide/tripeptide permease